MSMLKKSALFIILISLIYIFIGIVSAKHVGRSSPRIASLLKPPLFNFDATYRNGQVLVFRVGMSKREMQELIDRERRLEVDPSCWNEPLASGASSYTRGEIAEAIERNSVSCIRYKGEGLLIIKTTGDAISEIQSSYIRNELI